MTDILLDAVHLDERLERLAEADKKNTELLELVKEILTNFDKDKQLSRVKMEELYKRYEKIVEDLQSAVREQLTYIEQMCMGSEHQGSTFSVLQQSELAEQRMELVRNEYERIKEHARQIHAEMVASSSREAVFEGAAEMIND